jgi:putative CocE/NonD family hydrolase
MVVCTPQLRCGDIYTMTTKLAITLAAWAMFGASSASSDPLRPEDYVIDDVLIETPGGAKISAFVTRPRETSRKLPAALVFTIYADAERSAISKAVAAASRGYVGVIGFTRGKWKSPDRPVPYEYDGEDARAVIDWISRQPWSDGRVGMYGGSYNGFTQWAAAKHRHPALKTIVPYCPNDPGFGLPMTNNVFLAANYAWPFYTTNNKQLDDATYSDAKRWQSLPWNWYRSGRPFREIDQVDGTPNPWLQRWLQHPAYDSYWQGMTVNGNEYAALDIPVLAIDGYYDDGQNNAVRRLQEHYKYRPQAEHYLVIGPYDHRGTQAATKPPVVRGYGIDPVAHLDTVDLTFDWFDYIFRGVSKPDILKDKINYQVMGANTWRHARSIEKMSDEVLTLYLDSERDGAFHRLAKSKPAVRGSLPMVVDYADRNLLSANSYPAEIVTDDLGLAQGLAFISEPFSRPVSVNGLFSATLRGRINKKDLDLAVVLYEVMPDGKYFHLSYTVQRASYARDMSRRQLLTPDRVETLELDKTLLVSRQLSKGSRLLVVLDVNRGPFAQVNYGTGKDVSDESIADAKEPLRVEWFNDSYVEIPVSQ